VKNKLSATNDRRTFLEKHVVIEYLLEPAIDGRVITLWLRLYRQSGKATSDKARTGGTLQERVPGTRCRIRRRGLRTAVTSEMDKLPEDCALGK
jgi:hypothetical protein